MLAPRIASSPARAARHLLAVGVDHLDLARGRHLAARLEPAGIGTVERRVARIEQGHDRRRLGHAIGVHQADIAASPASPCAARLRASARRRRGCSLRLEMSNSAKRGWLTSMLIMVGTNCACVTFSACDGLQHLDRLEARHEGVAAAHQGDAEGRGAIGEMEHRRRNGCRPCRRRSRCRRPHSARSPPGWYASASRPWSDRSCRRCRTDRRGRRRPRRRRRRLVGREVLVVQYAVGRGDVVEPDRPRARPGSCRRAPSGDGPSRASMNSATAPESSRMYSISGAASRVLSGTMTAPIQGMAYINSK